ncbi:hypothetical protein [Jiella marina]|uniref:hypothetical protein n=1 Tax=Jiella sp. LLJ827 TaxID=2917712 RepID=UPI002100D29A|nr:hypothetical protein [Jiella sp. LLJ827]MCQ0989707.1 hypothetical protein [Jiella sp. LLJ827]
MRNSSRHVVRGGIAVALVGLGLAPAASSADYFARYHGDWTGGGPVKVAQLPEPTNVFCDIKGTRDGGRSFSLSGQCRAMLVLSRKIGATLRYDPETDMYRGAYEGSSSGPAKLQGKLEGATLNLKVTWNKTIYDDQFARMLIENRGGGAFTMKVLEQIDGKEVVVSDLSFENG